jgi:hypothetical protein
MTQHRTPADLQKTIIDVRTCEIQVAARRGRLDAMRMCGHATAEMERSVVVKQVELELLKVIEEEIADALSPDLHAATMIASPRGWLH